MSGSTGRYIEKLIFQAFDRPGWHFSVRNRGCRAWACETNQIRVSHGQCVRVGSYAIVQLKHDYGKPNKPKVGRDSGGLQSYGTCHLRGSMVRPTQQRSPWRTRPQAARSAWLSFVFSALTELAPPPGSTYLKPRLDAVIDRAGGGVISSECIFNVQIEFCYIHCGTFHENAIASVLTVSVNAVKKNNIWMIILPQFLLEHVTHI